MAERSWAPISRLLARGFASRFPSAATPAELRSYGSIVLANTDIIGEIRHRRMFWPRPLQRLPSGESR
jgi:hypothetical protein